MSRKYHDELEPLDPGDDLDSTAESTPFTRKYVRSSATRRPHHLVVRTRHVAIFGGDVESSDSAWVGCGPVRVQRTSLPPPTYTPNRRTRRPGPTEKCMTFNGCPYLQCAG
jgi:hypothetical protein